MNDTAWLMLHAPSFTDKLCTRKAETGLMSRAVKEMSANLHEVVQRIEEANNNVKKNKEQLETSIGVNDIAEKTSNVVEVTSDNFDLTSNTVSSVNVLKEIVETFEFDNN